MVVWLLGNNNKPSFCLKCFWHSFTKSEAKLNAVAPCFQTSHWSHESYLNNFAKKHPLRSNAEGYGCKTHSPYSEYRNARITSDRMLCYLPFSLLVVNLWTCRQTKRLTQLVPTHAVIFYPDGTTNQPEVCRVIQKHGLSWTVNGASTHARQLVVVFHVLCSLYGLTCVGYAQNCLEFISRSPLIHVVGRSFCLYTDSLFAQIGDSNDKCLSSLEAACWNKNETRAAQQLPTQF